MPRYVRYKNRVYSVGDDRSFFQTQFNTFIFAEDRSRSVGNAGWIDLTNPPIIKNITAYAVTAKDTYPVYGVELTIKDIMGFQPESQNLLPKDYRIIGTGQRAFPVDYFSFLQEFYVGLLQEDADDALLGIIMHPEDARRIVYSNRVNELVGDGVFIGDAVLQYIHELGLDILTPEQERKLEEIEESNYSLSLANTLLDSFQQIRALGTYSLPPDQVNFSSGFGFVEDKANYQRSHPRAGGYYRWGQAGGSDGQSYDCSGFVGGCVDEFEGKNRGHFMSTGSIRNQYPNQVNQYRSNNFKGVQPGMVVTSNQHTGICVGYDKNGEPVIAHSAGGGKGHSKDNSGITLTPASVWNKQFGIVHVAAPPSIMGKVPKGSPPPSMAAMENTDKFAESKKPGSSTKSGKPGENKNKTPQGGNGIDAPFVPEDYGVYEPMPFVVNPPPPISEVLAEDVDPYTAYNMASAEFVGRQRIRQGQMVEDKNPPESARGKENYYPVFTGVITNMEKKSSVDGYVAVLTLKNPSVFLYSNKSSGHKGGVFPGTTTLADLKQNGADIITKCLTKAGFDPIMNTIQLQKDQQYFLQDGSADSGANIANAADGGSGARRMEKFDVNNKSGLTGTFGGTPEQNYQDLEEQTMNKYKNIDGSDLSNVSDAMVGTAIEDANFLQKMSPKNAGDFPNVISANSPDALPSKRNGGSGLGSAGSGGVGGNYEFKWPKITNREKSLINIIGDGTEVYKGIWEPWCEWQDEKKTGKGGNPIAFDGLTLKESIEAVCSATNFEAYFDEEGLFWYRPPQFDVNPYPKTRYWFTIADGKYIKDIKVKVNYHKIYSGAYVSGSPIIWDTPDGKDIPTRVDAYIEDPQITEMVGWKPMINGDPYWGGSHFGNKYIIDTSTAYYYALSQLDRAHGQFITGKLSMIQRPDLVLGHTLYLEFMDLVIYITRIVHMYTHGDIAKTGTDIYFSYGRRFNDLLAYNNYGHHPTEPRKGMTIIDVISPADMNANGGTMTPQNANVIDIPPASNQPETLNNQVPSDMFQFPGEQGGDLNALPSEQTVYAM